MFIMADDRKREGSKRRGLCGLIKEVYDPRLQVSTSPIKPLMEKSWLGKARSRGTPKGEGEIRSARWPDGAIIPSESSMRRFRTAAVVPYLN